MFSILSVFLNFLEHSTLLNLFTSGTIILKGKGASYERVSVFGEQKQALKSTGNTCLA